MPECKTCEGKGTIPEPVGDGSTIDIECPGCCGTGSEF